MIPGKLLAALAATGKGYGERRYVRAGLVVVAFNALCALLLSALDLPHGVTTGHLLVYAQTIGLTTFAIFASVISRCQSRAAILIGNSIAIGIGLPGGWIIGSLLLGESLTPLFEGFTGNWQRITTLTALLATLCMYFFWSSERLARARADMAALEAATENARQQAEKRTLAAQFQALQAQIEPHFLFNTLANLRSLIGIDQERAQVLLDQLTDWLRAALKASRQEESTLRDEFDLLSHYLEIQSLRLGSRLRFSSSLPDDLAEFRLPPLLVQPLVENAVRHGIEPAIEGGWIGLSAFVETDHIVIGVADSGVGLSANPGAATADAIGLENVRARLRLRYGEDASLHLQSRPEGGLIALIRIPHTASP